MSGKIEHLDAAAARLRVTVEMLHAARAAGELRLAAAPDHVVVDEATSWAECRGLRSAAIEHVDEAAERLGITVANIRAAHDAGELRYKCSVADFVSSAAVNVWAHERGIAVSAAAAPELSGSPTPARSSSPVEPASSSSAMDAARLEAYKSAARQLGQDPSTVIANARPERLAGRRTVAHVDYGPRPAATPAPVNDPAPAQAFAEYLAPSLTGGMRRKGTSDTPDAAAGAIAPSSSPPPPPPVPAGVTVEVPELVGGRRRTKVAIDYGNALRPEDLKP